MLPEERSDGGYKSLTPQQERLVPQLKAAELKAGRLNNQIERLKSETARFRLRITNILGMPESVLRRNANAQPTLATVCMAEEEPWAPRWAIAQRVPYARLTLLEGVRGADTLPYSLWLAARVSAGRGIDGTIQPQGDPVILITHEPYSTATRDCLIGAGANLEELRFPGQRPSFDALFAILDKKRPGLLLVDPLAALCRPSADLATIADQLNEMSVGSGWAILIGRPMSRQRRDDSLVQQATCHHLVVEDHSQPGSGLFTTRKNSLGPLPLSLSFLGSATGGLRRLTFAGDSAATATELLAPPRRSGNSGSQMEKACRLLIDLLADGRYAPSTDVENQALDQGISEPTLNRARKRLGIKVHKTGGEVLIFLPKKGEEALLPYQPCEVS